VVKKGARRINWIATHGRIARFIEEEFTEFGAGS
jgi:hypothetical protein